MTQQMPSEQASIAAVVQQLQDLVKLALECKDREVKEGVSLSDISRQVLKIRAFVEELRALYDKASEERGLSEQEKRRLDKEAQSLPPEQKKILEAIATMQAQCETARDELYQSLNENKGILKQVEETLKDDKSKAATRKGKFKGVGGKKGWIPS